MAPSEKPSSLEGFSLLELLLVLGISSLLIAASLSAYSSITQATSLSVAAQEVSDLLATARQQAMTRNETLEVRIYDSPSATSSLPTYHSLQIYVLNPDKTTSPASNLLLLPTAVAIDATATHSTLIASNPLTETSATSDPQMNAQTRLVPFSPDGSTNLDQSQAWFLTLRAAGQADPTRFPSNWACITLDPVTGRSQILRP